MHQTQKLKGQSALITGANSGIGYTITMEMANEGARVNSLAPGAIKTPINRSAWDTAEAEAKLLELIPYNRVGEPLDIAKAAVWLASDDSDYVHGVTLFIDGGMTLYPGFSTNG